MKEIEITRKTAEIVLRTIDEAESANLKSDIIKMGHFNGNIFNKEQMFNHNAVTLGRFLINVAAYIGEKRFKKMMEEICELLWATADDIELLYIVNELHSRKNINI
jgi:trehalose utilization protein